MKESNRILLSALSLILVAILVVMAIAKNKTTGSFNKRGLTDSLTSRTITPQPFQKLEIMGAVNLKYSVGSQYNLSMEADSETLNQCVVENSNGTLKVSLVNQVFDFSNTEVRCHLTAPVFPNLDIAAGATFRSADSLMNPSRFEIHSSAGASAEIIVFTDTLRALASAGSELRLKGKATEMTLEASAGSEINAKLLTAHKAEANASSGAEIVLNADELQVGASSGAEIRYERKGRLTNSNVSSGATVNPF